jgi:two-component system sensor histidine kinase ChiS
MKQKLLLATAIICIIAVVGGLIIFVNINTIFENDYVRDTKTQSRQRYYQALYELQSAQKLLFKHQAGYGRDIDDLVSAVDLFDREILGLQDHYDTDEWPRVCFDCHAELGSRMDHVRGDLSKISELAEIYKLKVSVMLTTWDYDLRLKLDEESSMVGTEIVSVLEETAASFDEMVLETVAVNVDLINRAKNTILFTTTFIVISLLAIMAVTIPAITRSVNILIGGADAIASGDFKKRIQIDTADEIGLLADRFNQMAQSLEDRDGDLRELHGNLENKVTERTMALEASYEQLKQAALELERANRELSELDRLKSDFISIASHELRTPLVTISGYIELLKNGTAGDLTGKQQEMIDIAARSSKRLTTIIRSILDVSRIELKKLAPKREVLDINELFNEAIADQKHFADRRGQNIVYRGKKDLPRVEGDENMLLQVFINLINNAVKYTPDCGRITISVASRDRKDLNKYLAGNTSFRSTGYIISKKDRVFLEMIISDTGVGIPKTDQRRVFDKFYEVGDIKAHSSGEFKFMGGGVGLGLSIAKGFVEEHAGAIWVESEGRDIQNYPGSDFHILLPALSEESALLEEDLAGEPVSAPEKPPAKREKKILLVDDDEDIVRFMEVLLAERYNLVVATSGLEGLEKVATEKPDLILLDVLMYDIDGYEVSRRLKGDEKTREIPIILFTAKAQKKEIDMGLKAGADDYLTKPFSNEELFSKLETYLS